MNPEEVVLFEPLAVRKPTAARMLDCGQTMIWKLCREGRLETIKVGNDDRVTVESIKRYAKPVAA